ncbi:MAG TPA: S16 family serine protease [Acidothermaceae bacterium]
MRRQAMTLLVCGLLALGLAVVAARLPVPYVRDVPGPVTDTLGSAHGKALITIGHPTATPQGHIFLVTVSEYGGPRKNISGLDVLIGWWNRSDAVIPRRLLYSDTQTPQQVATQDNNDMIESQEEAKVAALRYLGYPLKPGVDVAEVVLPALKGKLMPDDIIVGVDGTAVPNRDALLKITQAHKAGDVITLNVVRGTAAIDVPVTLQPKAVGGTGPTIGISVVDSFTKPFTIDINLADVGGPSAGTAFALGIIDKLTDGNLTGGHTVAVTGTIDADGNVGAIGGPIQKMAGARHAGATAFLLPKDNCAEALKAVPHGLRVVPITTLAGAVDVLKEIRAGDVNLPSCPS